ncbi:hypothetical protein ABI59_09315 [Acidobacteria bacterium Mor1]|nr:hypothetical protein ABI59_09315 [Acidobacteria bacterium Mor1]
MLAALGCMALFAALCPGCSSDRPSAESDLCSDSFNRGDFAAALEHCTAASPDHTWMAATAHYALGQFEESLAMIPSLVGGSREADGRALAGSIHADKGDFERAELELSEAVNLYRAAGRHELAAGCLYRQFYMAWERSNYREAFETARGSLQEAERAGDPGLRSQALQALFSVLYEVGDLDAASRALDLAHRVEEDSSPSARARHLLHQSAIRLGQGRYELARHASREALQLAGTIEDAALARSAALNLAEACLALGHATDAADAVAEAWKRREPEAVSAALRLYQARVHRALGKEGPAEQMLQAALVEHPATEWAWELEFELGELLAGRGEQAAAEAAFDRSAALVDELRERSAYQELKAWLAARKRRPYRALFEVQAQRGAAQAAIHTSERMRARAFLDALVESRRGDSSRDGWARVGERLSEVSTWLPSMNRTATAELKPVGSVLEGLADHHVLSYVRGLEHLWLIALSEGHPTLRPLASLEQIAPLVAESVRQPDSESARKLSELLLPVDALPSPGQRIHVVHSGLLRNIPFAALWFDGEPLVARHPIALAPSLHALLPIRHDARAEQRAVVAVDPRRNLPAAAAEGIMVAQALGVTHHEGVDATAAVVLGAKNAGLLHLAAHAGVDLGGPWIDLADQRVSAADILRERMAPRLVVLASCSSASRRHEEPWGSLATTFLASGSRHVVAALGSVDDLASRDFIRRFYQANGAHDPVLGVAQAQRASIRAGEPTSSWAPFVVMATGRTEGAR